MLNISFIGYGRLAQALGPALRAAGYTLPQILGRRPQAAQELAHKLQSQSGSLQDLDQNNPPDLLLLCVQDQSLNEIAHKLQSHYGPLMQQILVCHCSGAAPLNQIQCLPRTGVFYPLQTLNPNWTWHKDQLPLCLWSHNPNDLQILQTLGHNLSNQVQILNDQQRLSLHLAAVWLNNFTTYCYGISQDICRLAKIDFKLLQALKEQTCQNFLSENQAATFQTGPARRHDHNTLKQHLELLQNLQQTQLSQVYQTLSQAIQEQYPPKL